ncbi:hypothetical protein HDF08_002082 [Edaphobacter lichenicola]|uniref:Uncharacterized protein n=1 Tax=Tunturiibacter lichenicola TaxID=2051959 RepID=A0A852VIK5_9BACT|nr:hypothetical protein [Edaphobacter lichenicola]
MPLSLTLIFAYEIVLKKVIGRHSFRYSLTTNLSGFRITLDVYTRATSETKRGCNNKVMEMVIEVGKNQAFSTLATRTSLT